MCGEQYREDLESDFSVFHRVDDMLAQPARLFVTRAIRLPAYGGALTASLRRVLAAEPETTGHHPGPRESPSVAGTTSPEELARLRYEARHKVFAKMTNGDGSPVWDGIVNEMTEDEFKRANPGVLHGA